MENKGRSRERPSEETSLTVSSSEVGGRYARPVTSPTNRRSRQPQVGGGRQHRSNRHDRRALPRRAHLPRCVVSQRFGLHGDVAQMAEHLGRIERVAGSTPAVSTNSTAFRFATGCEAGGTHRNWCEPVPVLAVGPVAQLEARLRGTEKVAGSNPARSTIPAEPSRPGDRYSSRPGPRGPGRLFAGHGQPQPPARTARVRRHTQTTPSWVAQQAERLGQGDAGSIPVPWRPSSGPWTGSSVGRASV